MMASVHYIVVNECRSVWALGVLRIDPPRVLRPVMVEDEILEVEAYPKRHHARSIILFPFSSCSRLGQTCFSPHVYLHFVLHAIHVAYNIIYAFY
jgi:hypothetical protein